MLEIKIVCVGELKNKSLIEEIARLSKQTQRVEIIYLKDKKGLSKEQSRTYSYQKLLPYLKEEYNLILLSEHGKNQTTNEFSSNLIKSDKKLLFLIPGAYGVDKVLFSQVDIIFSLSMMTFTHEQALYLLLEQIYRAQCLEKNKEYCK